MSWELASFLILGAALLTGFGWYERSRPTSQVVALVAALAALAIVGRIAFAAFPNVKPTTDIVIFAGFALGGAPGFAVGALSALVSNFWFGQGPWTPWQMAGWGLCGILGAALALVVRNPGRLTLAAVCGFAGIAYGALLNFHLMVTYGGDLSLERFLALESQAVAFDLAHAIGNATLAFVAGPAMVRMLSRFRERFEWRVPAGAAALLAVIALVTAQPAKAQVAGVDRAANWLVSIQNADGGWGPSLDRDSSEETTCWAMLGLEAAGRNPLDVARLGRTPVDFLRGRVEELESSGDFARTILALEGAGVDPRSFGGRDLVSALEKRRRENGSFEGWPNSTAFAVMALRAAGVSGGLKVSLSWLGRVQNDDGGWGDMPGSSSTADGTAAVMEAMPDTQAARRGLAYLRRVQRPSGGFPLGGSGGVNSQSTAWAVQGMLAVGEDPASIREGGNSALDYLVARQAEDGHYMYSDSKDQTPVWVTGQALAATAEEAFPVSPAPRKPSSTSPAGTPPPVESGTVPPVTSGGVPPSTGGLSEPAEGGSGPGQQPSPPFPSAGGVPFPPGSEGKHGEKPESAADSARPATALSSSESPSTEPWAPLGIALATGGLALGSVLLLGRRFGW
ncbi:MAG TPA: prenyltransferase/squalene oxidase repeat-containing protein [Solirubrobacterales bacterium]|jgi:energy-coupling factor transport system substrate-specific component